jgi:plastocyanin
MSRHLQRLGSVVMAALVLVGCAGVPASSPPSQIPGVTLDVSAERSVFDHDRLNVPADTPFAVRFDNKDVVPHNVSIRGAGVAQVGEIFGGPAERTYLFSPLPAGTYTFICDLHPEMRGVFEVTLGSGARP